MKTKPTRFGRKGGALVAQVRYGEKEHIFATKIGDHWWFTVRLGKSNMLRCDCGGEMKYRPKELNYDDEWGGCSHIVALFKGNITSNPKEIVDDYRVTYARYPIVAALAKLTTLGERMFHWRWMTLKWKD